jgi:hypothetical protein
LNDEGQQQMVEAAQQEAPEEMEVGAALQLDFEEADDQPQVTYMLVEF